MALGRGPIVEVGFLYGLMILRPVNRPGLAHKGFLDTSQLALLPGAECRLLRAFDTLSLSPAT